MSPPETKLCSKHCDIYFLFVVTSRSIEKKQQFESQEYDEILKAGTAGNAGSEYKDWLAASKDGITPWEGCKDSLGKWMGYQVNQSC